MAKAMELLQKTIALDDTFAEAYSRLGFIYSMRRQHDKGIAEAEKGVTLNPNSASTHFFLGKTLSFAGRWEESIPEYKKAIRLNPYPAECGLMEFRIVLRLYGEIRGGNNMV